MKVQITNMTQFNNQVKSIVNKRCIQVLNKFKVQAKGSLMGQTQRFRGKKAGSIADEKTIVYTIRKEDLVLTVSPTPLAIDVFRRNAIEQSGGILMKDEAPEWFNYHDITRESVTVRPTGVQGHTSRSPLGSNDRKFFENTYNFLSSNAQTIIDSNW